MIAFSDAVHGQTDVPGHLVVRSAKKAAFETPEDHFSGCSLRLRSVAIHGPSSREIVVEVLVRIGRDAFLLLLLLLLALVLSDDFVRPHDVLIVVGSNSKQSVASAAGSSAATAPNGASTRGSEVLVVVVVMEVVTLLWPTHVHVWLRRALLMVLVVRRRAVAGRRPGLRHWDERGSSDRKAEG